MEFQKKFWDLQQEMLTCLYGEKIANKIAGAGINILGGSIGIKNKLSEVYAHSLSPYTAKGNTNGGDINTCSRKKRLFIL